MLAPRLQVLGIARTCAFFLRRGPSRSILDHLAKKPRNGAVMFYRRNASRSRVNISLDRQTTKGAGGGLQEGGGR
eukprot:1068563-Pyramimonas_sp.AAC.1